ncbi:hypothetical protein [Microbaculum marinum]|uniref:Uncharacterized protein n=1 Tax=Microbaculum marinum TaxID=1764581 RepID=A0AAW9S058_9HYPH
MTGQRTGRLVIVERGSSDARGNARWRCRCDCGAETVVRGHHLRTGNSKSCGCFKVNRARPVRRN